MLKDFLNKEKIGKIYSYREERMSDDTIEFGWHKGETLDLDGPVVVSYPSKSKKVSDDDKEWSDREGKNASNLKCYMRYFSALTSLTANEFIETWEGNLEELEAYRRGNNPSYKDGEGLFLFNIAYVCFCFYHVVTLSLPLSLCCFLLCVFVWCCCCSLFSY